MPVTMEPTITSKMGVPVPSVKYGKATLIEVRVIVFPPQAMGGDPIFVVDPIIIPGSGVPLTPALSVLACTLVDGGIDGNKGFTTLEFASPGFTPSPGEPPFGVAVVEPKLFDVERNKRLVSIENNVRALTEFNYSIEIKYTLPTSTHAMFARHDPTIVLTTEPIDG